MALTLRTNGSGPQNLVNASWWNDFYNLLTGAMLDQPVALRTNLTLQIINGAPSVAPTSVASSGGSLSVGTYKYAYTFLSADGGESLLGPSLSVTVASGSQTETLTIATGPAGTAKRNIYRTKVGSSTFFYLGTINDNTTTSYVDSAADSTLPTTQPPTHTTFGGSTFTIDQSGNFISARSPDGTLIGNESLQAYSAAPSTPSAIVAAGGSLAVGNYQWVVAFAGLDGGETLPSQAISATTTSGNQTVNLTIPVGPPGTFARSIYRTQVGGSTFYFLAKVNGNSTTTYTDSAADASLTTSKSPLLHPTFGGALRFYDSLRVASASISLDGQDVVVTPGSSNGTLMVESNNAAGVSIIKGRSGIGFETSSGSKLAEFKGSGNMVIQGNTYFSNGQTPVLGNGSFDGFDIGETYQVDQEYPAGTVLCPGDTTTPVPYVVHDLQYGSPVLSQCTHDGCNLAHVVTQVPGFSMGVPNLPDSGPDYYNPNLPLTQCMALSGRVFCRTANDIPGRTYVCSDGRGGVRAVVAGEKVMALGVTLAPTDQGMVPVAIRPMFISL